MSSPDIAVVEGVNVDALAAAVRSCPAVQDVGGGPPGSIATYVPGRQLTGIRIECDRVTVQVRGTWDVPIGEMTVQIRRAAAPFVGDRTVDIVLAALSDPDPAHHSQRTPTAPVAPSRPTPRTQDAQAPGTEPPKSERRMLPKTGAMIGHAEAMSQRSSDRSRSSPTARAAPRQ